jgi:thiamine-monophosphate kinase
VPFRDEAQFVRWLRARWPERAPGLDLGIGDDAAVVTVARGRDLVLTTDLSLEGIHFRQDLHPPRAIGHRALARAISDLAAMGARPRFALISLALARSTKRAWMSAFYDGLATLAHRLGVTVIGGDTAVVEAGTMIDFVAVGEVERGRALRRAGAQPGDRVYVSGRLGLAALGLALLKSGTRPISGVRPVGKRVAATEHAALAAHLYPEPRCRLGMYLAVRRLASAAIDVSDGFARDLGRLCEASGCGAVIREDRLPLPEIAGSRKRNLEPLDLGLYGGEDYELIFTVPRSRMASLPRAVGGVAIHEIGEIRRKRGLTLVSADGQETPLEARGYDHFERLRALSSREDGTLNHPGRSDVENVKD